MTPHVAALPATWPETVFLLGVLLLVTFLICLIIVAVFEHRKNLLAADQTEELRRLLRNYEQLSKDTLNAQERTAADLAELRARMAAIEQILRTVE
jgi:Tfp pilus assembly protein PilO